MGLLKLIGILFWQALFNRKLPPSLYHENSGDVSCHGYMYCETPEALRGQYHDVAA